MKETAIVSLLLLGTSLVRADAAKPNYADDVLPIVRQSCQGCHSDDKQKGGLNLATFAAMMQGGSSGAAVVPGKPDESRLYTLTNHTAEPKMPPKADKIAAANLETIRKWIEQGARENSGSKEVAMAKAAAVALPAVTKGKPATPPMPGKLPVEPITIVRRPGAVTALAASPWAPVVALGGSKQISLYNTDTAQLLGVLPFPHGQINSLRFSRNGKLLLAAGGRGGQSGKAVLFDIATGKPVIEVGQETDAILSADISNDQTQIAVGSPSKIVRVYSTADGSVVREIKKHTDWVTAVEYSPDGVLLASGDRNGGLFVWEASTGREFFTLKGPTAMITSVAWRDDANSLAVSSEDGTLRLFEMENGTQTKTWPAHPGGAACVRVAHDGRLVSTGRDKVTKLWDAAGAPQKAFTAFKELGLQAAITHDASRVVASDWNGFVMVSNVADGALQTSLDADPLTPVQRAERAATVAEAALALAKQKVADAKAAFEKANGELAALTKIHTDATATDKAAKDAVTTAFAEVGRLAGGIKALQVEESAKVAAHAALNDAATKVQDAAGKAPASAELKALAAKAADLAKNALADLEATRKALATATASHKVAEAKHAELQKAAQAPAAKLAEAQVKLTATQNAVKPLKDALANAEAALAKSTADRDAAKKAAEAFQKK